MVSEELKPCPFCGEPADISGGWASCSAGFSSEEYREKVGKHCHNDSILETDEWNTRPLEDALQKRIEILQAALREFADPGNWDGLMWSPTRYCGQDYPIDFARRALEKP